MATLTTLAQYHMNNGDHMDGGWGWGMAVLMLIALVAVVALVVWVVRSSGGAHAQATHAVGGGHAETPMQVLDRRLAAGEVTPEDYKERAAMLSGR
jgi:putative membrane protein